MDGVTWVPIREVLDVVESPHWTWTDNTRCKYLNIRLDTRTMTCVLMDRDGEEISLRELSYQIRDYI